MREIRPKVNILKVLERGPLRLVKVTITRPLRGIYSFKGHFHKGDLSVVKVY